MAIQQRTKYIQEVHHVKVVLQEHHISSTQVVMEALIYIKEIARCRANHH